MMNRRHRLSTTAGRARRIALAGLLLVALLASSASAVARSDPSATDAVRVSAPVVVNLRSMQDTGDQGLSGPTPWFFPGGASRLEQEKAVARRSSTTSEIQSPPTSAAVADLTGPLVSIPAIDSFHSKCFSCYPPDGALAVGPSHVVGAVNTAIAVWDKSGDTLLSPMSLSAMLSSNTSCRKDLFHYFADPFVEYDASANRFIVGMLNYDILFNTKLCVAATVSGDPTSDWYVYAIPVDLRWTLFDFPQAAVGSDALYVTGNKFKLNQDFLGTRVYAIQSSVMYAGSPLQSSSIVYQDVTTTNAAGDPVDTLIPAKGVDAPDVMYFTAADNCDSCDQIRIWKWSSPFSTNAFDDQGAVTVEMYAQPPGASQPGDTTIETNDTRELASYAFNGTVFGAHAIGCDPGTGTVACVQWYQVGNVDTNTPTLLNQGIAASNDENRFYPTLAVDSAGNMALGYAFSSATDYAGIRYTGVLQGNTTLEPEQILVAGQKSVWPTGTLGRYGDYGTAVVDPSDGCTIWQLEEYAQSNRLWGTWLGSYRFDSCGP